MAAQKYKAQLGSAFIETDHPVIVFDHKTKGFDGFYSLSEAFKFRLEQARKGDDPTILDRKIYVLPPGGTSFDYVVGS